MRRAGRLVGHTLSTLVEAVRPGITLLELDALAERVIRDGGGIPSFLGYHGFPATLCLSPNDWIVHGIPNGYVLKDGDILSIDCGAIVDGWHGDAAVTVPVGQVDEAARRLIETTERAMWAGIAQVRAGNRLSDIGHAVEKVAAAPGYGVVRELRRPRHRHPHARGAPGPQLRPPRPRRSASRSASSWPSSPWSTRAAPETRVLDDGWTVRHPRRLPLRPLRAHRRHHPHGPEVLTLLDGARQEDWLPTAAQRR